MSRLIDFSGLSVGAAQRAIMPMLKEADIDEPVMEARLLLGAALGGGPERVLADRDEILTPEQANMLTQNVSQRCRRVPMSQILGQREFWSMMFKVTPATLTPRPDTETLVEALLEHVPTPPRQVLDLGTGTGCILLALLSEWPAAEGVGMDASIEALSVADDNAKSLGFGSRTTFKLGDWMQEHWTDLAQAPFDVVVSNPPYIRQTDMDSLEVDVRDFEPMTALVGPDTDGLGAYRAIIQGLDRLFGDKGIVGFEVGIGQAQDVVDLLEGAGFEHVQTHKDLGGIARAVIARKT